jgi:hypothetical protein
MGSYMINYWHAKRLLSDSDNALVNASLQSTQQSKRRNKNAAQDEGFIEE